jgi:spermidine/putrescine transport system ATP-binding protein
MRGSALEAAALSKRFGNETVVDTLSLSIEAGEFFSLVGPSGCGKTTTLRMIAGLETPTSGRILLGGRDVTGQPAHRRPVNTVFQHYALFPHLTAEQNIAFGLRERRASRSEIAEKVSKMLELVNLPGRHRARTTELSGGQQQRVALARALVLEPELLLLDEPLAALDYHLRRQMQEALQEIHREVGVTFVLVTHDLEEAFSMADRVGVMHGGRLQQVGAPNEVYHRPATLRVASLIGTSNALDAQVATTRGAGGYGLRLAGGVELDGMGADDLKTGDAVTLILRPEAVELAAAAEPPEHTGAARFEGTVASRSYLGSHVRYRIDTPAVGSIVSLALSGNGHDFKRGDSVIVSWKHDAAWAVLREGEDSEPVSQEAADGAR